MSQQHSVPELLSLPKGVETKLREFRRLTRQIKIIEAVLAAVFGFVFAYLLLFGLDRVVDTPSWMRLLLLLSGMFGFAIYLPYMFHRWVWNTRTLEAVAKLLEYRFPSVSDQVLSVVELAKSASEQRRSPQLIAAAMSQVDDRLFCEDLTKGVPVPRVKRWLAFAIPVAGLALLAAAIVPTVSGNTWIRYLLPFAAIERFTFARLEHLPREIVVPYAEPFQVALKLKDNSDWKPNVASLSLAGQSFRTSLSNSIEYPFLLPGQLESNQASIRVGDAVQTTHFIPMTRPELVRLQANVTLPDYLQYPSQALIEARGATLSVLRGSQVEVIASTNRRIAEASLSAQRLVRISDKSEIAEANQFEAIDLGYRTSGHDVVIGMIELDTNHQIQLSWRDEFGLSSLKPTNVTLRSLEDASPVVSCSRFPDPPVLLSTDLLKFDVSAMDDFGLQHVGIEWRSVENESSGKLKVQGERQLIAGKFNATKLDGLATLSCEKEKIIPQWLEIRAYTEDFLPGRGRVYSVPYLIHIMSPDEHAQWLAEQIRRWKGKADAVYEEELRLLEENRRIRDLSSSDLDTEETRKRMDQQAVAELNNSKRLESIVGDGQRLLEQALRNEEIRANQIEQWAKALERMDKLAHDAMPRLSESIGKVAAASSQSNLSDLDSKTPLPSLNDDESSTYEKPTHEEAKPAKQGGSKGRLTIPDTQLAPSRPVEDNEEEKETPYPAKKQMHHPAKKQMDEVVKDHSKLIEEFRQAKQAFEELLIDFENSTFVKRFKSASQFQKQIAGLLTQAIGSNFGQPSGRAKAAEHETAKVVEMQKTLADKIRALVTDLSAYQANNPAAGREAVIKEIKERETILKLEEMPQRIARNLRGDALNRSEFWADTFDRWAEELAGPGGGGGACSGGSKDSLPPALLLEVMRIIGDEIDLRDETRTLTQLATPENKDSEDIRDRVTGQAIQQMAIQERTLNVFHDIEAIPESQRNFDSEMNKLKKAIQHMDDASAMLSDLRITEDVIAAQTAAIESLIETRRCGGRGGGGGDSAGDGSGASGDTERNPLDLVGPGADRSAKVIRRQVGEGTGKTGRQLPEQYRNGLDRFLNRASKK